jgi:hypothetical protein
VSTKYLRKRGFEFVWQVPKVSQDSQEMLEGRARMENLEWQESKEQWDMGAMAAIEGHRVGGNNFEH